MQGSETRKSETAKIVPGLQEASHVPVHVGIPEAETQLLETGAAGGNRGTNEIPFWLCCSNLPPSGRACTFFTVMRCCKKEKTVDTSHALYINEKKKRRNRDDEERIN